MLERRELFPNVIELNFQARRRMGCCVYLIYSGSDWMLLDIGYEDTVDELINLIRQLDFPLANCRYLVATHADADHVQGFQKAKEMLLYEGLTVSEIAWKLNYSSVAHLSNQFNKITGLRPTQFKKNSNRLSIPLEQIGLSLAV